MIRYERKKYCHLVGINVGTVEACYSNPISICFSSPNDLTNSTEIHFVSLNTTSCTRFTVTGFSRTSLKALSPPHLASHFSFLRALTYGTRLIGTLISRENNDSIQIRTLPYYRRSGQWLSTPASLFRPLSVTRSLTASLSRSLCLAPFPRPNQQRTAFSL